MRIKLGLVLGFLVTLLAVAAACKSLGSRSVVEDALGPGGPARGDACASVCANTTAEADWAVCYSCRCKAAFDGYLPSPDEVSCDKGKEIEVYALQGVGPGATLQKITAPAPNCVNPPRLADARGFGGGCNPGSRFGQIDRGPLHFKFICRRETPLANYNDPNVPFDDFGIIGFNERTGATCFWDDRDHITTMHNTPALDLTDRSPQKIAAFTKVFYRQEGERTCIGCHDNDPFMYSPYLSSVRWKTNEAITMGFYHRVTSAGARGPIGPALVSEAASPCTTCHRIGFKQTCNMFAEDSMGGTHIPSLDPQMAQNLTQSLWQRNWGILTGPQGGKQYWSHWMPETSAANYPKTGPAWEEKFGKARQAVRGCCGQRNAVGCEWEDIPMGPDEEPAAAAPTAIGPGSAPTGGTPGVATAPGTAVVPAAAGGADPTTGPGKGPVAPQDDPNAPGSGETQSGF